MTVTEYRVAALQIPELPLAPGADVLGFDLDGEDVGCGVSDFPGSVDNGLAILRWALEDQGFDLQRVVDGALCTPATGPAALSLVVRVSSCDASAEVEFLANGRAVGSVHVTRDAGRLHGHGGTLQLRVPRESAGLLSVLDLSMDDVSFSATEVGNELDDVVLGGRITGETLHASLAEVDVAYVGILSGLWDLQTDAGRCGAMSAGPAVALSTAASPPACQ